ncbi:MAG: SDR family NAD(P)-dependent oxidoreductase [Rhodococcus sp. (in: high G+C Gram-positive bacteria)]|uniref:SDR family NAD(P)-dependent oxidoreductase n=1 Tax=Rhodococcus sp. TaxID=1831 RepID=UPI002AD6F2FB|nr:SDR family NAD(P)-dependent oxidoreductase [Rhodococcus sp. (in: high G+C Gram-positive bacteria)]
MNINGQVTLVTGGASGLGRATAATLLGAGARVVVVDLATSEGQKVADKLGAPFVAADVTDEEQVAEAIAAAAELGDLRAAVHCAGIVRGGRTVGRNGPLPLAEFASVISVNLIGTFNVIRLAAAQMALNDLRDGDRGVVVATASVAAYEGQIGQAAYSASKSGVVGMMLPIARDLSAVQIRINAIAPGVFETPMITSMSAEQQDSLGKQALHPARLGHPSEYGALAAHIIANPMLNGEVIRLDGAIRMAPR